MTAWTYGSASAQCASTASESGWSWQLQAVQAEDLGARVVVAEESGHFVPLDQPEVVVAAIEDVVAAVRDPSSWATPPAATPEP